MSPWTDFFSARLSERDAEGLLRQLRPRAQGSSGRLVSVDGRSLLNCAGNDYLGLSGCLDTAKALPVLDTYGWGSGGSRLLGGDTDFVAGLEREWARRKGFAAALFFNGGYAANIGVACALGAAGIRVLADRLIHASVLDGLRVSGGRFDRFRHNDVAHAEELLSKSTQPSALFVESVYSMDGDHAPLQALVDLARRYNALLVVDEAHSDGIDGHNGCGALALCQTTGVELVQITTFGKAYGAFGAAVSGSASWIQWMVQSARSLIFATALPPLCWALTAQSWDAVAEAVDRRKRVLALSDGLRRSLRELDFDVLGDQSPIVPVVIGEAADCVAVAEYLWEHGVWAPAVRPPTVPEGSARLRLSWTALHTEEDVERVVALLRAWKGSGV